MSRSRKKNPISWMCSGEHMKEWKRQVNRKIRHLPLDATMQGYHKHKFADIWLSPSDGKIKRDDKKAYRK